MRNSILPTLLVMIIVVAACTPKKKMLTEKWFENPNGESELALTMRDMFEAMASMKFRIENGKKIKKVPNFDQLLTDIPTDASMKNETFEPFAKAWLAHLESMKTTDKKSQAKKYKTLINTCIACHENSCHGPIVRIKKLYID